MIRILCCVLVFVPCFALNIEVDYGVENNKRFSIITLKHSEKFPCQSTIDINHRNTLIECVIDKTPDSSFPKNTTEFFDIYSEIKDNKFHLFIKARKNQELFATFFDLKNGKALPVERPKNSRVWQIVGFGDEIPFLSKKKYNGINFPISIPNAALPYIREINIDASPLVYDEGVDFGIFLQIRQNYENKKYAEALQLIDDILDSGNDSIFRRDLGLYKIRAMYKSSDIEPDDTLEVAKQWKKLYPSDINIPEVLFMVGDLYSKMKIFSEARYYFNRIIDEYEDSKYVQYALVGLAKNLFASGDKTQAPLLFSKAYENAKDIDTASFVALSWGDYELKNDQKERASVLFKRVIDANPQYFLKDINESYNAFRFWVESGLYGLAAKAGDSMLPYLDNNNFKENLMNDVGHWYELDSNVNDAHRVNTEFLNLFADSREAAFVKNRDDNLLFKLDESDADVKLAQYDYLIATYPNTPNAELANEKKAAMLFNLGKFDEVIAMKNSLKDDDINVKNAYIKIIESSQSCDIILKYYLESNMTLLTQNRAEVFECLFDNSLFAKAQELSILALGEANEANAMLKWLYNEARASYRLRDFNKAAQASRDAFALAKGLRQNQDSGFLLFLSLANLNRQDEAMRVFGEISKIYPNDSRMLQVYNWLLTWALDKSEIIAIETYAKEMMRLQKQLGIHEYTPFIEMRYADVLFSDNRYEQMLEVLDGIDSRLNDEELRKVLYMRGTAYYELGDNANARSEFTRCSDTTTSFGRLCEEGLRLLE